MTLCDAIKLGLYRGKAITRDEWDNTAIVRLVDNRPMLEWHDGDIVPWHIDTLDFIADDYRIVEGFLDNSKESNKISPNSTGSD